MRSQRPFTPNLFKILRHGNPTAERIRSPHFQESGSEIGGRAFQCLAGPHEKFPWRQLGYRPSSARNLDRLSRLQIGVEFVRISIDIFDRERFHLFEPARILAVVQLLWSEQRAGNTGCGDGIIGDARLGHETEFPQRRRSQSPSRVGLRGDGLACRVDVAAQTYSTLGRSAR